MFRKILIGRPKKKISDPKIRIPALFSDSGQSAGKIVKFLPLDRGAKSKDLRRPREVPPPPQTPPPPPLPPRRNPGGPLYYSSCLCFDQFDQRKMCSTVFDASQLGLVGHSQVKMCSTEAVVRFVVRTTRNNWR